MKIINETTAIEIKKENISIFKRVNKNQNFDFWLAIKEDEENSLEENLETFKYLVNHEKDAIRLELSSQDERFDVFLSIVKAEMILNSDARHFLEIYLKTGIDDQIHEASSDIAATNKDYELADIVEGHDLFKQFSEYEQELIIYKIYNEYN